MATAAFLEAAAGCRGLRSVERSRIAGNGRRPGSKQPLVLLGQTATIIWFLCR